MLLTLGEWLRQWRQGNQPSAQERGSLGSVPDLNRSRRQCQHLKSHMPAYQGPRSGVRMKLVASRSSPSINLECSPAERRTVSPVSVDSGSDHLPSYLHKPSLSGELASHVVSLVLKIYAISIKDGRFSCKTVFAQSRGSV